MHSKRKSSKKGYPFKEAWNPSFHAGFYRLFHLRENAVKKLLQGQTTYQEVLRITWEQA